VDVKPRYLRSRTGSNTVDSPLNDDGKLKVRALSSLPNGISTSLREPRLPMTNDNAESLTSVHEALSPLLPMTNDDAEPLTPDREAPVTNDDAESLTSLRKPLLPATNDDAESLTSDHLPNIDEDYPSDSPTASPSGSPSEYPSDSHSPSDSPTFYTKHFTPEQLSYLDEQVGKEETEARANIRSALKIKNVVTCNIQRQHFNICPHLSGATMVQLDVGGTGYVSAVRVYYDEGL